MRIFSNSIRSKDFNLRFSHTLLIYLFDLYIAEVCFRGVKSIVMSPRKGSCRDSPRAWRDASFFSAATYKLKLTPHTFLSFGWLGYPNNEYYISINMYAYTSACAPRHSTTTTTYMDIYLHALHT